MSSACQISVTTPLYATVLTATPGNTIASISFQIGMQDLSASALLYSKMCTINNLLSLFQTFMDLKLTRPFASNLAIVSVSMPAHLSSCRARSASVAKVWMDTLVNGECSASDIVAGDQLSSKGLTRRSPVVNSALM